MGANAGARAESTCVNHLPSAWRSRRWREPARASESHHRSPPSRAHVPESRPPGPRRLFFQVVIISLRKASMPSEDSEAAAVAQIKDAISRLQSPVSDTSTLLRLLVAPLNCIGLLPPRFRKYDTEPLSKDSFNIARHIQPIQRALLEHVIPAWEPTLVEEDCYELVEQYFCPDSISFASSAAGQLAVLAYSTILSSTLHEPAVRLLLKLCRAYPIDVLHSIVASSKGKFKEVAWEDCVRNVAALPTKVANAMGPSGSIPAELQLDTYFGNVSLRCERLMFTLSNAPTKGGDNDQISHFQLLTGIHRRYIPHSIFTD